MTFIRELKQVLKVQLLSGSGSWDFTNIVDKGTYMFKVLSIQIRETAFPTSAL